MANNGSLTVDDVHIKNTMVSPNPQLDDSCRSSTPNKDATEDKAAIAGDDLLCPSSYSAVDSPLSVSSQPSPSKKPRNDVFIGNPMLHDDTLPPGWSRKVTQRTMGASAGKYDVYILGPDGKKIRSKTDLMLYLKKMNLDLDPNDFDFSVRGRHNMPPKAPPSSKSLLKAARRKLSNNNSTTKMVGNVPGVTKTADLKPKEATSHSSGQKLIVKFNFPVPRLKRSHSQKLKKVKRRRSTVVDSSDEEEINEVADSNSQSHSISEHAPTHSESDCQLTNGHHYDQDDTDQSDSLNN